MKKLLAIILFTLSMSLLPMQPANAFWGFHPGNWFGPGWGGYPYYGHPWGGYGYPWGGYGYPWGRYGHPWGGYGYPYYGVPYYGAYHYPYYAAPVAPAPNTSDDTK